MKDEIFRFKKFSVNQNKTAMKVGVDAVLLGACADFSRAEKILDIGSGTGIISLMAAQKSNACITAIEIEYDAYLQTVENIKNSIWSDRITAQNIDFNVFFKQCTEKFDSIVCNPPFFINSYKSEHEKRNLARSNENLPFETIFEGSQKLLEPKGILNIIFPANLKHKVKLIAEDKGFFTKKIIEIKPNINKDTKRIIQIFTKDNCEPEKLIIAVETDKRHEYTTEYTELTKEFYLKM